MLVLADRFGVDLGTALPANLTELHARIDATRARLDATAAPGSPPA